MAFKIIYDPSVTNWLTMDTIRKTIYSAKSRGQREISIRGNLRADLQHALLKITEEHPNVTLRTGRRLLVPIESRAGSIDNFGMDSAVAPDFLGISMVDYRAAEDLTKLRK